LLLGQAYPVIFLRQQNRGAASVGFRDNPEPRAIARAVGRQNAPAGLKADSFSRPVELIHVAPIMRDVMNEAAQRIITITGQGLFNLRKTRSFFPTQVLG